MTYGITTTITADASVYDTLHRQLLQRTGGVIPGLLVHIGRSVDEGFQVTEVWESKDQFDRCNREVVWPLAAELFGQGGPVTPSSMEEFEPRGLVIPTGPARAT